MAEQGAGKWGSMVKADVLAPAKLAFESTKISAKISFPFGGLALSKGEGEESLLVDCLRIYTGSTSQKMITGTPFVYECLSRYG